MTAHLAKSLPAKELIDKSICPVKKEYVSDVAPRQYVDQVQGSSRKEAASNGKRRKQDKPSGYIPSKDGLCFHFARNTCTFGEKCRFSHDIAKYLAQRPPDLPGKCPFISQDECPYQITCRWASTHKNPDKLTKDHLLPYLQSKQGGTQDPGVANPPASPASAEAATKRTDGAQDPGATTAPASAATTEAATADASRPVPAAPAPADVTQPGAAAAAGDPATPSEAAPAAASAAAAPPAQPDTVALPVADSIEQPVNTLTHTLVHELRKYVYDFGRADKQLSALGLSNNLQRKDRKPKPKAGNHVAIQSKAGDAGSKLPAAEAGASTAPEPAPAAADAPGDVAVAGEGNAAVGGDVKVADAGAAADVDMTGAGGKPDTATAAADAAAAAPASDSKRTAATSSPSPGAGPPGHAAKRQRVADGPSPVPIYDVSRTSNLDGGLLQRDGPPRIDFRGKLYCAPLTTSGNLPFRRVVKHFGCDITCGEMALTANLLQGQQSEWALLKRHPSEDIFGVQICGAHPDSVARCVQLLDDTIDADFIDINMGCPIDLICSKGMGSAMLTKPKRMEHVVRAAASVSRRAAITFKTRTGYADKDQQRCAADILAGCGGWGAAAVTLHGRTRNQRYSRLADWGYVERAAEGMPEGVQLIGNGDVLSWEEYAEHMRGGKLATCMIARGALIKPWLFTEIKEERHWDITSGERLEMLKNYCSWGLQHWGSDSKGVETTRSFLLEWLSFLCRYVPVGLMEVVPQRMTWRPPPYVGRNDLETLMASSSAQDWVRISEMLLGPAPPGFSFAPKHKSNAYVDSRDEEVQG